MNHDLLLSFLSEKGHGTWKELKEAHDWLAASEPRPPKAWWAAADLSALGHLEISWEGSGTWSIAPPVATMLPNSGGRALITGARTRALCDVSPEGTLQGALVDAAEELGMWLDCCPQRGGPSTLLVAASSHEEVRRLAGLVGIHFTFSTADQIARMLPALDDYARVWTPGDLPRGLEIQRFDAVTVGWHFAENSEERGLYKVETYGEVVHVLRAPAGQTFRVPREPAVYEVLRWDQVAVLEYLPDREKLVVPQSVPLPTLHARAATLCSGRLPAMVFSNTLGHKRQYDNVPVRVASLIARSLSQEIECEAYA